METKLGERLYARHEVSQNRGKDERKTSGMVEEESGFPLL